VPRLIAIVCLVFGFAGVASGATTSNYDVEIVVFENQMPDLEGGENLASNRPRDLAADLSIAEVPPASPAESGLLPAMRALEKDARYRVLAHQRWTQAADAKSATKPVRISDAAQKLDGVFRFYLSRFLHVEMNLVLQGGAAANPGEELVYRLQEHRRVRTQELHYFDHPKFGALVRVTPAAKP
jgi:hypothetical protein